MNNQMENRASLIIPKTYTRNKSGKLYWKYFKVGDRINMIKMMDLYSEEGRMPNGLGSDDPNPKPLAGRGKKRHATGGRQMPDKSTEAAELSIKLMYIVQLTLMFLLMILCCVIGYKYLPIKNTFALFVQDMGLPDLAPIIGYT